MEKLGFTKARHTFEGDGEFKSNLAADRNCGFSTTTVIQLKLSVLLARRRPSLALSMGAGTLEKRFVYNATVCADCQE